MDNNRIINYINEFKEYVNVLENTQISSLYGEDIFPALMGKVFSLSVGETLEDENSLMEKLTLINYEKTLFFWSPESIDAATNGILNSLFLAFVGASIAMVLALVVSYMIHRTKGMGSAILDFL